MTLIDFEILEYFPRLQSVALLDKACGQQQLFSAGAAQRFTSTLKDSKKSLTSKVLILAFESFTRRNFSSTGFFTSNVVVTVRAEQE